MVSQTDTYVVAHFVLEFAVWIVLDKICFSLHFRMLYEWTEYII